MSLTSTVDYHLMISFYKNNSSKKKTHKCSKEGEIRRDKNNTENCQQSIRLKV